MIEFQTLRNIKQILSSNLFGRLLMDSKNVYGAFFLKKKRPCTGISYLIETFQQSIESVLTCDGFLQVFYFQGRVFRFFFTFYAFFQRVHKANNRKLINIHKLIQRLRRIKEKWQKKIGSCPSEMAIMKTVEFQG